MNSSPRRSTAWLMLAGALFSVANVVVGWSWALADAQMRSGGDFGADRVDWGQAGLWVGVPAAATAVLALAGILHLRGHDRAPAILTRVVALVMGLQFVLCATALVNIGSGMVDDRASGLEPWALPAYLIGMFVATPVVFAAVLVDWLKTRKSAAQSDIRQKT